MRVRPSKRRPDRHRLAVVADNGLLVHIEREPKDTAVVQLLVDHVRDEREVLHVTSTLNNHRVKFRVNSMSSAHHHQGAELPLARLDAHNLVVLRLEVVFQGLVRVEVADIVIVQVHELVDLEDFGELLPLGHEVVVAEEGDVDGVLEVRLVWPGSLSAVERLMEVSLVGRTLSAWA